MEPAERGRLTVAIVTVFTDTMKDSIARHTQDPAEQLEVAGAVIALLTRKMYQQRGDPWLEAMLKQVLQP